MKALPQGEVIVFGRVKMITNGEPVLLRTPLFWTEERERAEAQDLPSPPDPLQTTRRRSPVISGELFVSYWLLHVVPNASSTPVIHRVSGDGSLYWHLAPGSYTITGFEWREFYFRSIRRIFAQFIIPEAKSIVYIGTLVISADKVYFFRTRGRTGQTLALLGGGRYSIRVEDEYEQAVEQFNTKFPEVAGEAVKSLMHLEKAR